MANSHTLANELIKHKMVLSMGEARRLVAQGGVRISSNQGIIPLHNLDDQVNVGETILVGCKKSFIVTEENES